MKYRLYPILFAFILLAGCNRQKEDIVVITTQYGDIKVRLYDKTPLHHDNFLALAESGYYNGTLFHRVINGFMIQGGDPDSRHARPGQLLGEGDTTYTIPFEYVPGYIHKRGALAAARESDDVNPKKASSGSQFYIVQGKTFTEEELDAVEAKVERRTRQYILLNLLRKSSDTTMYNNFKKMVDSRDTASIRKVIGVYKNAIDAEYLRTTPFKLSKEHREVYKTVGGAPHLDGAYTVFGEVVSGMDVVDRIAGVQRDSNDRPGINIPMTMKVVRR
jgi:cyclophilin family peptidyl-prolyl cis-trans isomerase